MLHPLAVHVPPSPYDTFAATPSTRWASSLRRGIAAAQLGSAAGRWESILLIRADLTFKQRLRLPTVVYATSPVKLAFRTCTSCT